MRSLLKERPSGNRNMRPGEARESGGDSGSRSSSSNNNRWQTDDNFTAADASIGDHSSVSTGRSRREKMAFLRYDSTIRHTPSTVQKSRQHTRQIAQATQNLKSPGGTHSKIAAFADFQTAFGVDDSNSDASSSFFGSETTADLFGPAAKTALRRHDNNKNISPPDMDTSFNSSVCSTSFAEQEQRHPKSSSKPARHSMSTLPSNSSMQASNHNSFVHIKQQQDGSYSRSSGANSAAARRRVRTQMQQRGGSSSSVNSNRSGGSGSSPSLANSLQGKISSGSQASARNGSGRSVGSTRSNSSNRSANSSATSGSGSADVKASSIFDSKAHSGGFTFDAFGLDATQINAQLNQAMHDLAGSHPEMMAWAGETDELSETRKWDDENNSASRASTPSREDDENGFVDGFKVATQSPTSSQGSSRNSGNTHTINNAAKKPLRPSASTSMQPNLSTSRVSRFSKNPPQQYPHQSRNDIQFVEDEEGDVASTHAGPAYQQRSNRYSLPLHGDQGQKSLHPKEDGPQDQGNSISPPASRSVGSFSDLQGGRGGTGSFSNLYHHRPDPSGTNVPSDAGVDSDYGRHKGSMPDFSASYSAPSGIGVSSNVAPLSLPHRPSPDSCDDDSTSTPLAVFTKDRLGAKTNKGSGDTATTASSGYSNPRLEHSDGQSFGTKSQQYEEKKEEQEPYVQVSPSRWDNHQWTQPQARPLTQENLDSVQRQSGRQNGQFRPEDESETTKSEGGVGGKHPRWVPKDTQSEVLPTSNYKAQLRKTPPKNEEAPARTRLMPSQEVPGVHERIHSRLPDPLKQQQMILGHRHAGREDTVYEPSHPCDSERQLYNSREDRRPSPLENVNAGSGQSAGKPMAAHLFEQSPAALTGAKDAPPASENNLDPRAAMLKGFEARGQPPGELEIASTKSSGMETGSVKSSTPKATMMMLNAFLAGKNAVGPGAPSAKEQSVNMEEKPSPAAAAVSQGRPALKDDPEYEKYFRMLKLGMPMEAVKHAMQRDEMDPSVMDGDHNKPVTTGVPLKDDPEYEKYFRMLKIGMPMDAVKHAMLRDGLDCSVMDQDHNLPARSGKKAGAKTEESEAKDSHRRARLHWKTLGTVTSNSLWARLDEEEGLENIEIDENEFQELFQAEKGEAAQKNPSAGISRGGSGSRATSVRVIDGKRANNGGIILARLKMSHDEMADAVDRINEHALTAEQIENIIEYLPSKEERKALESYMLEGGQDAAEKFDGLCECEKFMVSMMTVKHAKRKVRALLFKLQFEQCLDDILQDTLAVEAACDELFNSVRLRQLLGIILTFGNRLNTAGNKKRKAGAFTLDSLLKLNQAKAFDKKTTFLHYVILIVHRNNEILLRFKDDLPAVFKADKVFWDQCLSDLDSVESQLENVRRIALYQAHQSHGYRIRRNKQQSDAEDGDESLSDGEISLSLEEEVEALRAAPIGVFTLSAIKYVSSLRDKVEETCAKYQRLLEYFGEEDKTIQPHELFSIIVKFCRDFDKAKEEVFANEKKKMREERKRQAANTAQKPPTHSNAPTHNNNNAPKKTMLRASSFQPSISAVMKSSQQQPPKQPTSQVSLHNPSVEPNARDRQHHDAQQARNGYGNETNSPVKDYSSHDHAPGRPSPRERNNSPPAPSDHPDLPARVSGRQEDKQAYSHRYEQQHYVESYHRSQPPDSSHRPQDHSWHSAGCRGPLNGTEISEVEEYADHFQDENMGDHSLTEWQGPDGDNPLHYHPQSTATRLAAPEAVSNYPAFPDQSNGWQASFTSSNQPYPGTYPNSQQEHKSVMVEEQPPAPTNTRSANMAALRHKARMTSRMQQNQRSRPAPSTTAQPICGLNSPKNGTCPKSPTAEASRSSITDPSFQQRRRIEARKQMRRQKGLSEN